MKLSIENSQDLAWAFRHNEGVNEIRFSAVLVREIGLDKLLEAIARFPDIDTIAVADDYIRETSEIERFENSLKQVYPNLTLKWTYDLRVDGKHGR